jgi:hypothetical protein
LVSDGVLFRRQYGASTNGFTFFSQKYSQNNDAGTATVIPHFSIKALYRANKRILLLTFYRAKFPADFLNLAK